MWLGRIRIIIIRSSLLRDDPTSAPPPTPSNGVRARALAPEHTRARHTPPRPLGSRSQQQDHPASSPNNPDEERSTSRSTGVLSSTRRTQHLDTRWFGRWRPAQRHHGITHWAGMSKQLARQAHLDAPLRRVARRIRLFLLAVDRRLEVLRERVDDREHLTTRRRRPRIARRGAARSGEEEGGVANHRERARRRRRRRRRRVVARADDRSIERRGVTYAGPRPIDRSIGSRRPRVERTCVVACFIYLVARHEVRERGRVDLHVRDPHADRLGVGARPDRARHAHVATADPEALGLAGAAFDRDSEWW